MPPWGASPSTPRGFSRLLAPRFCSASAFVGKWEEEGLIWDPRPAPVRHDQVDLDRLGLLVEAREDPDLGCRHGVEGLRCGALHLAEHLVPFHDLEDGPLLRPFRRVHFERITAGPRLRAADELLRQLDVVTVENNLRLGS